MSFFVELWESVFTPGTTPALITATHISFILLILSLIALIFLSKSIHFVNLLVIAILLYGSVIWFINELKTIKLKDNEQLEKEAKEASEGDNATKQEETVQSGSAASGASVQPSYPAKKRKV